MKKFVLFLVLALAGFVAKAQETPPTGLLPINSQLFMNPVDSAIWHFKGVGKGWERLARHKESVLTVGNLTLLQRYTGNANAVIVQDALRGGVFKYFSTTLVPDSGTVFPATGRGSGFWQRIYNGPDNVKWWGAKGDGVTDDYSAIQAWMDAHTVSGTVGTGPNGTPPTLFIPDGIFMISNTIRVPNGIRILGNGRWSSMIFAISGFTGIMMQDKGNASKIILENFQLSANNQSGVTDLLNLGNITVQFGTEALIKGLMLRGGSTSALTGTTGLRWSANVASIEDVSVWYCANSFVETANSVATNYLNCVSLGATGYAYFVQYATVTGCEVESPSSTGIGLYVLRSANLTGFTYSQDNSTPTTNDHAIEMDAGAFNLTIAGFKHFNNTSTLTHVVKDNRAGFPMYWADPNPTTTIKDIDLLGDNIIMGLFPTGTAGTDNIVVKHGNKFGTIPASSYLTGLTGPVTSVGNATTITPASVTNAMLAGSIDLTAKVTGVLPYANGGINVNTSWTQGSVIFAGASGFAQNNSKFYWDNISNRLGLGSGTAPANPLDVRTTANEVPISATFAGAGTSVGSGNGISITNSNSTTNNWADLFFADITNGSVSAAIGAQFTNRSSHYASLNLITNGPDGFLVRASITNLAFTINEPEFIICPSTAVSGSTSGTATFSMPEQGASYKKVVIYLSALIGTATYTLPTAYTSGMEITYGVSHLSANTITSTSISITTSSAQSGYITIEGY